MVSINNFCLQGPLAFYKGFIPNFARLGSWNVIMFLTLEQVINMRTIFLIHIRTVLLFFIVLSSHPQMIVFEVKS